MKRLITGGAGLIEIGLFMGNNEILNQVYDGAWGDQISLNAMIAMLENIAGKKVEVMHRSERPCDVGNSKANTGKTEALLVIPKVKLADGLNEVNKWYLTKTK